MAVRRRTLLAGAAALTLGACTKPRPPATVQTVTPIWSELGHRRFGVNTHPNFLRGPYGHTDAWLEQLGELGIGQFRGFYAAGSAEAATTVRGCRERGLRWGAIVCTDMSEPVDAVVSRIKHLAREAADVCLYVEGVNEPNYVRGGGAVDADWAEQAVMWQRIIFEAVRDEPSLDHALVLGPSLQAQQVTQDDYDTLADLGLARYLDAAGVHSYPGGFQPDHQLMPRIEMASDSLGGVPVWVTEFGYTNDLESSGGHRGVPEEVSGVYAPIALLDALDNDFHLLWYELVDDVDSGVPEGVEQHFGLLAADSGPEPPWRRKPAADAIADLLAELRDPGPTYRPRPITLTVDPGADDVRWTVTGKRDGSVTLYARRNLPCWDPVEQQPIEVDEVSVTIEVKGGDKQTVSVGSAYTTVLLGR